MTMGNGTSGDEAALARDLFEKIDRSDRQKYSVKVKTLMNQFGYDAARRVRQSSLDGVVDKLAGWGVAATFASLSRSANDWVTLSRAVRPPGPPPRPLGPSRPFAEAPSAATSPTRSADGSFSALHFAFRIDDAATEAQSRAFAEDIVDHLWSFRPVMLVVEGDDGDLGLAGALAGAIMRRRALFLAGTNEGMTCPSVPEVLTPEVLGRVLESNVLMTAGPGTVLLLRVDADDPRADATLALARDVLVPHAYRLQARAERKVDTTLTAWLCAFAGAPNRAKELDDKIAARDDLDVAALFTEVVQARDALVARACERGLPKQFTASNESTEHMALKASAYRALSRDYAGVVRIEQTFEQTDDDSLDGADEALVPAQKCRPDVRVEGKKWVEVETLRGRAKQYRDPFFELERRLLKPVQMAPAGEEVMVLVPSDLAMLASRRLEIVSRNLRNARGESAAPVKWGFLDLESDAIIVVDVEAAAAPPVELRTTSWRQRRALRDTPRTWKDVAGYGDLRERITAEILDPLRDPGRYRRHGLKSASGLLLYGLPGCGKSLLGRVLAGEAGINCKILYPSDLTSMWIGEGTSKIREVFDWALDQDDGCLLVLDELDAVAPVRVEANMHSDEKRQVNELLVQLDRVHRSDKPIVIVGTTNYMRGIDGAIRRSGRFDVKIPVFPPDVEDRKALFRHFISALEHFDAGDALEAIDTLAEKTPLFAPADVESVVMIAARRAIFAAKEDAPRLKAHALCGIVADHQRSITRDAAEAWLEEARIEVGGREPAKLSLLKREIDLVYAGRE